jgi:hypothetical protein
MRILASVSLMFLLSGCATDDSSMSATGGASWYSTMHRLSVNHSALAPVVADPKEFYNPKNISFLREKANEMMKASVEMTKDTSAPNADPIIAFTAKEFSQELQGVSEMLDTGKLQAAHYSLSQVGNYCISCHSRADRGSKNFPLPWATNLSQLNSSQKATYYLANRQYETAHQETEKIIQDNAMMMQDPSGWLLLLQKDLSVIVRVQKDLPRAQKLTALALKNKNLQDYIKYDIQAWSESLQAWKAEDKRTIEGTKNLTFVKKLLDQARSAKYARGQSGFVLYLRASGILHELLEGSRDDSGYASALYFAGVTAEALKNVDVWKLGEHYFEVCIENSPNTVVAQKCYQQLENLLLSSHPNMKLLPDLEKRIQERLAKYKDLSRAQPISPERIRPSGEDRGPRF